MEAAMPAAEAKVHWLQGLLGADLESLPDTHAPPPARLTVVSEAPVELGGAPPIQEPQRDISRLEEQHELSTPPIKPGNELEIPYGTDDLDEKPERTSPGLAEPTPTPASCEETSGNLDTFSACAPPQPFSSPARPPATEPDDKEDDSEVVMGRRKKTGIVKALTLPPPPACGESAPPDTNFCPISLVSKYPYRFCPREYSEPIAQAFFNEGKFYKRELDLYYIWPPTSVSEKPLLFITETQLLNLLGEINDKYPPANLRITEGNRDAGLVVQFAPHPSLRPRYLGRSHSREQFNDLEANVPGRSFSMSKEDNDAQPDRPSLEAFKAKMQEVLEAQRAKNKAGKAKKRQERMQRQQAMGKQLKRAQRYLGLRPSKTDIPDSLDRSVPTSSTYALDQHGSIGPFIPPLDTSATAPYPFDSNVVIVSVDVEAYERSHSIITEVGIATLDTADLVGVSPGPKGDNWVTRMRARHFRIQEYAHLKNGEYVAGCPEKFDFGQSEFVNKAEANAAVASCFREPFSEGFTVPKKALGIEQKEGQNEGVKLAEDADLMDVEPTYAGPYTTATRAPQLAGFGAPSTASKHHNPNAAAAVEGADKRRVVLLGHDTKQDIQYLNQLGYNPLNLSNLHEVLDTAALYMAHRRDSTQPRSLATTLYDLDLVGWNLHNAGNDAVYTLRAMLALCVAEAAARGSTEARVEREERRTEKLSREVAEVLQRNSEEARGWISDENSDGGVPVDVEKSAPKAKEKWSKEGYAPSRGETDPLYGTMPPSAGASDRVGGFNMEVDGEWCGAKISEKASKNVK
ncbi:hypothetical protein BDY21DRAFT_63760 [Lineolata rhizophorae]|uniref:Gfd2/YDR514C-like C-terminal domain-containing protein n=1 Tax=Lineolata rhizophorae TaxID=578093 RepID=A0A6A6NW30_9PEZI|nr:hypothetical protein BDY21DRAFT_63760 [Lineolata rhizophorae]